MQHLRWINVLHRKGRSIEGRGRGAGSSNGTEEGFIIRVIDVLWLHRIREIGRSARGIVVHGSLVTFKVHVVVIVQGLGGGCCGAVSRPGRGIVVGRIERVGHGCRFVCRVRTAVGNKRRGGRREGEMLLKGSR